MSDAEEPETRTRTAATITQNQTLTFSDFCEDGSGTCQSKPCSECDQVFSTNGLLDMHWQKVHDAAPLLHCNTCDIEFRRKMALITHYRTHPKHHIGSETKLIGCDICDAFNIVNGFTDEKELHRHTRKVHGPEVIVNSMDQDKSVCPLPGCGSDFAYRKGMIEHLQILHGEHLLGELLRIKGPEKDRLLNELHFKCRYCSKVYRVRKSLLIHLSKRHGDHKGENSPLKSPTKKSPGGKIQPQRIAPTQSLLAVKRVATSVLTPPPSKMARLSTPTIIFTPVAPKAALVPSSPGNPATPGKSGNPASGEVSCPVCQKSFTRQSVLNVHSQMVHGTSSALSPPNPLLSPSKATGQGDQQQQATPLTPPLKERMRLSSSAIAVQPVSAKNPVKTSLNVSASALQTAGIKNLANNSLNKTAAQTPPVKNLVKTSLTSSTSPVPISGVKNLVKTGLNSSTSTIRVPSVKNLVKTSFQSRVNSKTEEVILESESDGGSTKESDGLGRIRRRKTSVATVSTSTTSRQASIQRKTVLASKLKHKYRTIASSKSSQQQILAQDGEKKVPSRTKRLPFKVRFNMESQVQPRRNDRRAAATSNLEIAATNATENASQDATKNGAKISGAKSKKYIESLFDEAYFQDQDTDGKLAQKFYGEEAILKEEDLEEECIIDGCTRKFLSYFSMMRHVAFHHRPARTARLMKLFD